MLSDFVDKLIGLTDAKTFVSKQGVELSYRTVYSVPDPETAPKGLDFSFLDSLVEFIKDDPDTVVYSLNSVLGESKTPGSFIVVGYNHVSLFQHWKGSYGSRKVLASAEITRGIFSHDGGLSQDRFILELLTNFEHTEKLHQLVSAVSQVSSVEKVEESDNGIDTKLTVSRKTEAPAEVTVKNPIILKPKITWPELNWQPEMSFIFRRKMDEYSKKALFTLTRVNDDSYKLDVMKQTKVYLSENLPDFPVY